MTTGSPPPRGTYTSGVEEEAKFSAWPGFEIPELTGVIEGLDVLAAAGERSLDATYFDTKALHLVREGITVRHRDEDGESRWTVKFPLDADDEGAVALHRQEVQFELPAGDLPEPVRALVRAYQRSADLVPVARLHTRRRALELIAADGARWGEVADDEVSVLEGDRVAARFREVEVEVSAEAPRELLPALVERLRAAGAGAPDPTPKLVRALGPRALAPPDPQPVVIGSDATVGDAVRASIARAVRRIMAFDHVVRLDDHPEGVHQMRVGTRRLRSDLRTFRRVVDVPWSEAVRAELGWLGSELGAVRDADVLAARLERDIDRLRDVADRRAADVLLEILAQQRHDGLERLRATLDSARYVALLDQLVAAASDPPVDEAAAGKAARKALPGLVGSPWRTLQKEVARLGEHPADERLHSIRIDVKRARYAAEVAIPVIGKPARSLAQELRQLQDVLGDHQDASVAEEWLRAAAPVLTGPQGLVAGELVALQRAEAARHRDDWRRVWKRASAPSRTGWLK